MFDAQGDRKKNFKQLLKPELGEPGPARRRSREYRATRLSERRGRRYHAQGSRNDRVDLERLARKPSIAAVLTASRMRASSARKSRR